MGDGRDALTVEERAQVEHVRMYAHPAGRQYRLLAIIDRLAESQPLQGEREGGEHPERSADLGNAQAESASSVLEIPEGLTPEKLREVADWLDTYDRMAAVFWDSCEAEGIGAPDELAHVRDIAQGTEVQDDLRRWADALAASGASPEVTEGEPG